MSQALRAAFEQVPWTAVGKFGTLVLADDLQRGASSGVLLVATSSQELYTPGISFRDRRARSRPVPVSSELYLYRQHPNIAPREEPEPTSPPEPPHHLLVTTTPTAEGRLRWETSRIGHATDLPESLEGWSWHTDAVNERTHFTFLGATLLSLEARDDRMRLTAYAPREDVRAWQLDVPMPQAGSHLCDAQPITLERREELLLLRCITETSSGQRLWHRALLDGARGELLGTQRLPTAIQDAISDASGARTTSMQLTLPAQDETRVWGPHRIERAGSRFSVTITGETTIVRDVKGEAKPLTLKNGERKVVFELADVIEDRYLLIWDTMRNTIPAAHEGDPAAHFAHAIGNPTVIDLETRTVIVY